jgi:hypothetical protein
VQSLSLASFFVFGLFVNSIDGIGIMTVIALLLWLLLRK